MNKENHLVEYKRELSETFERSLNILKDNSGWVIGKNSAPPVIFSRILLTLQVPDKLPTSKLRMRFKLPSDNPNIMNLLLTAKGVAVYQG